MAKIIKRDWIMLDKNMGIGNFIAVGQWADGRLAYSLCDADGNEDPKHESCFVQIRYNGKLVMIRL